MTQPGPVLPTTPMTSELSTGGADKTFDQQEEIDDVAQMNFSIMSPGEALGSMDEGGGAEEEEFLDAEMGFHPDSDGEEFCEEGSISGDLPLVASSGQEWRASSGPLKQEVFLEGFDQGFRLRAASRREAFLAIFDDLLGLAVTGTNSRGARLFNTWKITSREELAALLGLFSLAGAFRTRHLEELWSVRDGHPLFSAAMSFGRFSRLCSALRAPVSVLLETFNTALRRLYEPGPRLAAGGTILEVQSRVSWQEIPWRPGRVGVKLLWIVDAANSMPLRCALFTGREVLSEEGYALQLVRPYLGKGRTIALDKGLTSLHVCRKLLQNETSVVGAVARSSREIPGVAKSTADRVKGDTRWFSSQNVALCSHWGRGPSPVLLLTTRPEERAVELIEFHTATSAAVTQLEASLREFSSSRGLHSWATSVFLALFDAAVIAAHKLTGEQWSTPEDLYTFKKELAFELCGALVRRRLKLPLLRSSVKESILRAFPGFREEPVLSRQSVSLANQGRCTFCPRVTDRKTRKRCSTCRKFICGSHQHILCPTCFK